MNKKKCERCQRTQPKSEFMPTTGYLWPDGRINMCYSCIEEFLDGDNLNEVDRLCQHANMAFLPNEWRKLWKRERKNAFRLYAAKYNSINYYKYDWGEQNEKLMELARSGIIENELDELRPAFIQELKLKWGDLPDLDLVRLERFFNASLADYNAQTEAEADLIRKVARLSILTDDSLSQGQVNKDLLTQYDRIMSTMLKTLETVQSEGITAIGQVVEFIERNGYKPNFYDGVARDELDLLIQDIKEFTKDLVEGAVDLGEIYEREKARQEDES